MKRKGIVLLTGVIIILVGLAFLLLRKPVDPGRFEKLRIGVFADTICAPVYIGQQQGFFKRHGLDVSVGDYQAGPYAMDDLLAGKADLATAAELVLALRGFQTKDLRAVGTISTSNVIEVIARRDRGIGNPEGLRGKRIGIPKGTSAEFFLDAFLSLNKIHSKEIRMVGLTPLEIVTAVSDGKIDAASVWSPLSDMIKKNLGGNAIAWPAQGGQDIYFLLITREELVKTRSTAVTGLLRGLLDAEAFLKKHEKEAQKIVERRLNLDHETLLSTWSKIRFRVGLDQSVLTLMEDEARWAIHNKMIDAEKVPNYFNFLYLEGLKKIKPEAVSVIH